MNKAIGILIAVVGLAVLAVASIPSLKGYIPSSIPLKYVIIAGVAILVLGAVLAVGKGGSRKQKWEEVPIYEGKNIVGYRKEKK